MDSETGMHLFYLQHHCITVHVIAHTDRTTRVKYYRAISGVTMALQYNPEDGRTDGLRRAGLATRPFSARSSPEKALLHTAAVTR